MSVPEKYEYCKPEDWDEMAESCPDAAEFLKGRSMYRQYLELRLVLYATAGEQRELVEHKLAELEAEIVSWPYRKPQPPAATATQTPQIIIECYECGSGQMVFKHTDDFGVLGKKGWYECPHCGRGVYLIYQSENTTPPKKQQSYYLDGIPSVVYDRLDSALVVARQFLIDHQNISYMPICSLLTNRAVIILYRNAYGDFDKLYPHMDES